MERLTKTISIDIEPDTISERIANDLKNTTRRGQSMNLLRSWMTIGKLIEECGGGIAQYLLAMDKENPKATQKERIVILLQYLQRLDIRTIPSRGGEGENVKPAKPKSGGSSRPSFTD